MSDLEKTAATDAQATKPPRAQRKSDGQDGPPVLAPPVNTPGAPNAALQEPPPKPTEGYRADHPSRAQLTIVDADRGIVVPTAGTPRRRKIAVCGFASNTRGHIAKVTEDREWEIWGLNQLYRHLPPGPTGLGGGGRADRWADLHWNWDQETVPGTDHYAWTRDCGIPVYMLHRHPALPTSVRYPIEGILAAFQSDYFTSTIAYLIALALWEIDAAARSEFHAFVRDTPKRKMVTSDLHADLQAIYGTYTIGLFGIDQTVGTEYFHEKACTEYWIGMAVSRGIEVVIPGPSALCKQRFRYGYERNAESLIKHKDVTDHKTALEANRLELSKRLWMVEGAIECDARWQEVIELRERGTQVE